MDDLNSDLNAEVIPAEVLSEISELLHQVSTREDRELIIERFAKKMGIGKSDVIKHTCWLATTILGN